MLLFWIWFLIEVIFSLSGELNVIFFFSGSCRIIALMSVITSSDGQRRRFGISNPGCMLRKSPWAIANQNPNIFLLTGLASFLHLAPNHFGFEVKFKIGLILSSELSWPEPDDPMAQNWPEDDLHDAISGQIQRSARQDARPMHRGLNSHGHESCRSDVDSKLTFCAITQLRLYFPCGSSRDIFLKRFLEVTTNAFSIWNRSLIDSRAFVFWGFWWELKYAADMMEGAISQPGNPFLDYSSDN